MSCVTRTDRHAFTDADGAKLLHKYSQDLFHRTRCNAKRRKIEFTLTRPMVTEMLNDANLTCAVTGLPLSLYKTGFWKNRPFAPSIDRINSRLGYHRENCRIVCFAANMAMSEWGPGVLYAITRAVNESWNHKKEKAADVVLGLAELKASEATVEGQQAFLAGTPIKKNPYLGEPTSKKEWSAGWRSAERACHLLPGEAGAA